MTLVDLSDLGLHPRMSLTAVRRLRVTKTEICLERYGEILRQRKKIFVSFNYFQTEGSQKGDSLSRQS